MKIAVVTGSRAEFGLLRPLLEKLSIDPFFQTNLIITGSHLVEEYGETVSEIESVGLDTSRKVHMLLSSDSPQGIAKSVGLGIIGFADVFADIKPDLVLFLGDRFEILSAGLAALLANIPMAHISGGEVTEGSFDDNIRHCLTKISNIHFAANDTYRARIVQLGENPSNVFVTGGLAADAISNLKLLNKSELADSLGLELGSQNFLITYHPETATTDSSSEAFKHILSALEKYSRATKIFTLANADKDGKEINRLIYEYVKTAKNAYLFQSLGHTNYLSLLAQVDVMIGNSSSGISEAPFFRLPVVNVGERQKGRLKDKNVIDCSNSADEIIKSVDKALTADFQESLNLAQSPYGKVGAAKAIISNLKQIKVEQLTKKAFYDIPVSIFEKKS